MIIWISWIRRPSSKLFYSGEDSILKWKEFNKTTFITVHKFTFFDRDLYPLNEIVSLKDWKFLKSLSVRGVKFYDKWTKPLVDNANFLSMIFGTKPLLVNVWDPYQEFQKVFFTWGLRKKKKKDFNWTISEVTGKLLVPRFLSANSNCPPDVSYFGS